ncbi:pyridoxamine 5'-phosphate oxidase family protein [Phascolarctobacterium sp.]|uniref:pyridoxamine 5'-phosphate oxidase family protein n=1 Tax=Phascolarctobacterium sp. TaxID=2049039 RepID=UPI0038700739
MRRKDREVTDVAKINEIISSCECMRIGFNDDGQVYIVPLNYGYSIVEGKYVFYFHGAKEGRKIDLIHKNPYVGFEMDTNVKINTADVACNHSTRFQSIIGNGKMSIVEDFVEKKNCLLAIMKQNTGKADWDIPDRAIDAVCVFKMIVYQLSCKEHA